MPRYRPDRENQCPRYRHSRVSGNPETRNWFPLILNIVEGWAETSCGQFANPYYYEYTL